MRLVQLSLPFGLSIAVCASAYAQGAPTTALRGEYIKKRDAAQDAAGARARAMAARAQCAEAIEQFDVALSHSVDPALHRDRGKCHEQLGNIFPAMDDYQTYLEGQPDAPDADDIRARLDELASKFPEEQRRLGGGGNYDYEMRGGVGFRQRDTARARQPPEEKLELTPAGQPRPLRDIEADEKRSRDATQSPLRNGTGPIFGFTIGAGDWDRKNFGVYGTYNFAMRYAVSRVSTLIGEVGVMNVRGTGTATQLDGITVLLGYEARIAFDRWANNQFVLGAAAGYANVKAAATGLVFTTFAPRARFGFRHIFGPAIGLEFFAEGGAAIAHVDGAPADIQSDDVSALIGGGASFLVGF